MPIGRRMELLAWAGKKENRYIIEDDYDSEFRYKGKPIPALQASDKQDKVIYIGTFSKSIAPAIRISYLVLPKTLLEAYSKHCSFLSSTVSRIDQAVLNEFITNGYFERYLNKMRKLYRQKQEILLETIEPMRAYFDLSGESAGLHVLLHARNSMGHTEKQMVEMAKKKGCKVYPLSAYLIEETGSIKETDEATLLLGYAAMDHAQIKNGIETLIKAWL